MLSRTTLLQAASTPALPKWRGVVAVLAFFGLLVCLRMPPIVIKGRFWAEEGSVFLAHAWTMPAWTAIWLPYGGYLNLVANASGVAASRLLPLSLAPYLTIAIGLLFQLCPPLLLLTARDEWLRPAWVRAAGVLLLLLMPASEEIQLQTLHCQFELALCCGMILALQPAAGWLGGFRLMLLGLAPLCGPGAIALLPLFMLRVAIERNARRALEMAVLLAASAAQFLLFYTKIPGRAYALHPFITLSVVTLKHLAIPFLGVGRALRVRDAMLAAFASGHSPILSIVLPFVVFGPFAVALARRGLTHPGLWLFAGAAFTAGLSYFGALVSDYGLIDVLGNQRYAIVPQLLLELALLALLATSSSRAALVPGVAVAWLLVVGATNYSKTSSNVRDGPAWRTEVAVWQADPQHALKIWPASWFVLLKPRS